MDARIASCNLRLLLISRHQYQIRARPPLIGYGDEMRLKSYYLKLNWKLVELEQHPYSRVVKRISQCVHDYIHSILEEVF